MTSAHSRARSSAVATRARMGRAGRPSVFTRTSGSAWTLWYQAGLVSSPPRDATTTMASPS